jgi:exopolyphosphatase/guanosine-5'-triphosphate,3'-diphosphate pyrophosphatase
VEYNHAKHVAKLAMEIFEKTKQLHRCGDREKEFLEAAALLHEIGLYLSHAQHHRHSYYFIRNAELPGFTENEKEIIANIARYHRKSHPKPKHEEFQALSSEEQTLVTKLAAILRIADGLDRTHSSAVNGIECRRYGDHLGFHLLYRKGRSIEMELWGAEQKKELFEQTFHKKIKFM